MQTYDVTIVGGGMMGLSLALGLADTGMRIAVVDADVGDRALGDAPELRVSAINLASRQWLETLGVWQAIEQQRLLPYEAMRVWDQDSFAAIEFSHQQVGQPQLGYIIENQLIRQQLWLAAQQQGCIDLIAPARVDKLLQGQQETFVHLDNDTMLSTRLVVGADGGQSPIRKMSNLPLTFWDYDHTVIVATVKSAEPHANCARQVFTEFGPLAFLPLSDPHTCSIVWSQQTEQAKHLLALDDEAFNKALTSALDARLGLCEVQSARHSFPLTMRYARQWVKERVVLLGDAAHTIHPLAGQGANLGFMDAKALTQALTKAWEAHQDPAAGRFLREYERARKAEAVKMIAMMEGFKRLFEGRDPLKKLVRGLGLAVTDKLPSVKQQLIQQAMGL